MLIASNALSAGVPLSVTRIVTGKVPVAVGVQLKAPVEALIVAPAGAPASNENVSTFAGTSESVAVAVKVSVTPGQAAALFPIGANTGAEFTSFTVIVIDSKSVAGHAPLSVTRTVIVKLPGPCASAGVQAKTPDVPLIPAPIGAPGSSENVRTAPASGSVAVAVKLRSDPSLTVLFPIVARTGGGFPAALTAIVIPSKSLRGGTPLSVTRIVTGKVPF